VLRLIRRAAVLTAFLLVVGALGTARGAVPPAKAAPSAFEAACRRAEDLLNRGAGGRAREVLADALASAKGPDVEKGERLLKRIDAALEAQYRAEQRARKRAQERQARRAEEMKRCRERWQKMLSQADKLVQEGQTGDPEKILEAARLRARVATERALRAYEEAVGLYEQGRYDQAKQLLIRLQGFVKSQQSVPADYRAVLGPAREKRIAELLSKADQAVKNQQVFAKVLEERAEKARAEAEKARKVAQAEAAYEAGLKLFEKGDLEGAAAELRKALAVGVSLGAAKDARLAETLKTINARLTEIQQARAAALAALNDAEKWVQKGDWRNAQDFWARALDGRRYLSAEQVKRLSAVGKEIQALRDRDTALLARKEQEAKETKEHARIAQEWLKDVEARLKVVRQQEKARAEQELKLAESDYQKARLESALEHAKQALIHDPENARALQLKEEITALIEGREAPPIVWGPKLSRSVLANIEAARFDLDSHMRMAKVAYDEKRYEEAISHLETAERLLAYLKRYQADEGLEAVVQKQLEQARHAKKLADEATERARQQAANREAEQAAMLQRAMRDKQKLALFQEATAEYARGNFENVQRMCDTILERDPENTAALDLRAKAREEIRRRTWDAIYKAQERNWEDERLRLKERLTWPAAHIQFPAKAVWEEILGRGGVELPSARAVKTPKELALEAVLDTEIEGFSYEETPLPDVINFFKSLFGEEIDFLIDPSLAKEDILITLTLSKVTLRQALRAMLRPNGLDFVISSNGYIYISTPDGVMREEAQDWNLSLRQYNIQDLLFDISETAGGNAGNQGGGNQGGGNYGGGNGGNEGNQGGGGADAQSVIDFIRVFTGPRNWDVAVAMTTGGGNQGNQGNQGGGGLSGVFGEGQGVEQGLGFGEVGVEGAALPQGPGRIMIERQGWLIVNHVDRIHKKIEEVLEMLRSQTTVLVSVEARLITVTDNFFREFAINFSEGGQSGWSHRTGKITSSGDEDLWDLPAANWTFSLTPLAHAAPVGTLSADIFSATASFIGDKQRRIIIRAVKDSEFATTVSAPHVICYNTQERDISLTRTGTYVSGYSVQDGIAIPEISTYTVSDTSLTVRPVVSADRRYVNLSVSPDITTGTLVPTTIVIPIRAVGAEGEEAGASVEAEINTVVEESQSIESTIKVPDRGTVVLGGLATAAENTGEGSIPILGHIPILKRLFIRSATTKARTHLIFMVTPTILLDEELEP